MKKGKKFAALEPQSVRPSVCKSLRFEFSSARGLRGLLMFADKLAQWQLRLLGPASFRSLSTGLQRRRRRCNGSRLRTCNCQAHGRSRRQDSGALQASLRFVRRQLEGNERPNLGKRCVSQASGRPAGS